jgi:delta8-fatty-acid desaturase
MLEERRCQAGAPEVNLKDNIRCEDFNQNELFITSGSVMLLALYGHGAIYAIYTHCHDVVVACLVASAAGLALLTVSKLIQFWRPMRHAGYTMQMRITDTVANWQQYPVRSAMESTFWLGSVIFAYEYIGDLIAALQVATVAAIVICLSSELFFNRFLDSQEPKVVGDKLAVAPVCIFAYGMLAMLVGIFSQAQHWMTAVLLSTIAGAAFTFVGLMCLRWSPTARAGAVINGRVLDSAKNWEEYPARSLLEVTLWLVATWTSFAATSSVFVATGAGALTGIMAVLGNHELGWGVEEAPATAPAPESAAKRVEPTKDEQRHDIPSASSASSEVKRHTEFTWTDVAKHNTSDDFWLAIDGKVYDVTSFAPLHPGGDIIDKYAGVDASDQFAAFHLPRVAKHLPRFFIGTVSSTKGDEQGGAVCARPPTGATLEYRALRQKLWREGFFEPDNMFYARKAAVWLGLISAAAAVVWLMPSEYFWLRTVGAGILLGIGWQQAAFMAHDAAHYGTHHPHSGGGLNWLSWLLGSVVFGISVDMWNTEHSLHHAITLRPQEDPQFNYLPIWLISMKELDVPGTRVNFLVRTLVRIQHFTFFPLAMLIGRFNFYIISCLFSLKRLILGPSMLARRHGLANIIGMAIYWLWHAGIIVGLEGWRARLVFVLTSHWICGILHVQLLVGHLMTDTFTAEEEREEQFFSFQLKTARNIDCEWYEHWFHGGLEYQIEHHLFPMLPRHNLSKVQPFIKDICQRHGIQYRSQSMSSSLVDITRDLHGLALAIVTLEGG